MGMAIDEFTLTYPGIKNVEHQYFYAVHGADDATRRGYLTGRRPLGYHPTARRQPSPWRTRNAQAVTVVVLVSHLERVQLYAVDAVRGGPSYDAYTHLRGLASPCLLRGIIDAT